MSYQATTSEDVVVAQASVAERHAFMQRTYLHLTGAIGAFVAVCAVLVPKLGPQAMQLLGKNQYAWLLVLGAFMLAGKVAQNFASHEKPLSAQYFGLGLFVVAEALIMTPLLYMATTSSPGAVPTAAVITGVVFVGLTAIVLFTKKDLSFMGRYLSVAGLAAMGLIAASFFLPFNLGAFFAAVMVAFMAASILYQTSAIIHQYPSTAHVAASLALFSSVATMFWYVLQLVMRFQSND